MVAAHASSPAWVLNDSQMSTATEGGYAARAQAPRPAIPAVRPQCRAGFPAACQCWVPPSGLRSSQALIIHVKAPAVNADGEPSASLNPVSRASWLQGPHPRDDRILTGLAGGQEVLSGLDSRSRAQVPFLMADRTDRRMTFWSNTIVACEPVVVEECGNPVTPLSPGSRQQRRGTVLNLPELQAWPIAIAWRRPPPPY
jgi:hypothetical protein